jgi:hypothetical protein
MSELEKVKAALLECARGDWDIVLFADTAERLAAAAIAAIDEARWQPIESAPRDGTPILLCANVRDDGTPYQSDVYHGWRDRFVSGGWRRWPHTFPPTHWQPFVPPKEVG